MSSSNIVDRVYPKNSQSLLTNLHDIATAGQRHEGQQKPGCEIQTDLTLREGAEQW